MTKTRTILVTGASRGIGATLVTALAARGHRVGCLSRAGTGPEGVDLPDDLRARMVFLKGDVLDPDSLTAALAALEAAAGPVSGLVNNAGIHLEGAADRQSLAEFAQVMDTNANATFSTCQRAYPFLVAAGGGLIVNMGSFFDKLGVRRNTAYCASKAAVAAITRCLAVEWASKGIRVVTMAPGYIATDLNRDFLSSEKVRAYLATRIPTGAPAGPEEVARLIGTLFTEDFGFLTGETIYLDGGQSIAH